MPKTVWQTSTFLLSCLCLPIPQDISFFAQILSMWKIYVRFFYDLNLVGINKKYLVGINVVCNCNAFVAALERIKNRLSVNLMILFFTDLDISPQTLILSGNFPPRTLSQKYFAGQILILILNSNPNKSPQVKVA